MTKLEKTINFLFKAMIITCFITGLSLFICEELTIFGLAGLVAMAVCYCGLILIDDKR